MSRLKFCVGKRAAEPYYIKKLHIRLYSMEELCFYLCENASLLDEELLKKELIVWIDEECGMAELAKQLYEIIHFDGTVHSFASAVLTAVCFKSPEEIKLLEKRIRTYEEMDQVKRKKAQADHIFLSGRYALALEAYTELIEKLLRQEQEKKVTEDEFQHKMALLLHNLATTCARMFFFEAAAGLYEKAYSYAKEDVELKCILCCKKLSLSSAEYEKFVQTRKEYESLTEEVTKLIGQFDAQWSQMAEKKSFEEISLQKDLGNRDKYRELLLEKINGWKKQYQFYVMY